MKTFLAWVKKASILLCFCYGVAISSIEVEARSGGCDGKGGSPTIPQQPGGSGPRQPGL